MLTWTSRLLGQEGVGTLEPENPPSGFVSSVPRGRLAQDRADGVLRLVRYCELCINAFKEERKLLLERQRSTEITVLR